MMTLTVLAGSMCNAVEVTHYGGQYFITADGILLLKRNCPVVGINYPEQPTTLPNDVTQEIIAEINKEMDEVRQETARKQAQSERDTAEVRLTAGNRAVTNPQDGPAAVAPVHTGLPHPHG